MQVDLDSDLLAALDKFVAEQGRPLSREEAIKMILMDALISYGIAPLEAPPPTNPKDAN